LKSLTVGILGLQGAIEEHLAATELAMERSALSGSVIPVKSRGDVQGIDGLVIPGGESTVIGRLAYLNQALQLAKERITAGLPVLGTCAGLILLAKKTYDRVVGETSQPLLGVMDVVVERNSFGRQSESFEADLKIPVLGEKPFRGIFIRAPSVREIGGGVDVLSRFNDVIVAVQQNSMIGTAFHPELTDDTRLHEYFLKLVAHRA
jgi:5'-phosphate synthase pdxT subunit